MAAVVVAAVTGVSLVVTILWNWLAPTLFGARTIGFWQALGLLVLTRILFGGFHGRPGGRMHGKRWEQMTPEEREKIRQGWRRACREPSTADAEPKPAAEAAPEK